MPRRDPKKRRPRAALGGAPAGVRRSTHPQGIPAPVLPQACGFLPPSTRRFKHIDLAAKDRATLHELLQLTHRHVNRGLPDQAAAAARMAAQLVLNGTES